MRYKRKQYLEQLIKKKDNGRIKIITGLRRSGKSYLLFTLFYQYLLNNGVERNQIIELALDEIKNAKYRNPFELDKYIRSKITNDTKQHYVLIDEIQFVSEVTNPYLDDGSKVGFIDVVLGLMKIKNVDIYVTGSNSKMLSSDVLTQFRDRGDEIRIYPLSFAEIYENYKGDKRSVWRDYYTYGGMPMLWSFDTHEEKSKYLSDLFERTYIKDILERYNIKNNKEILNILLNVLASSIGSLTNPSKLANTFLSERQIRISSDTIETYINYFLDAFILQKAQRYDIKGRRYIKTPNKYYFSDVGLRNAKLGFRQIEETHLMENVLYNDLVRRGYDIDVGIVEENAKENGKNVRKQLEVDFVVNRNDERYYIQSALSIDDSEKKRQEIASLIRIPDSFKKIVIVKDYIQPWTDDNGIYYMGIEDFLLNDNIFK